MQAMALALGGHVESAEVAEFGRTELEVRDSGRLLAGLPHQQTCWMSHRDTVFSPPPGFAALASSPASPVAAFESVERGLYGIQFHPEVVHTPHGTAVRSCVTCRCTKVTPARSSRSRSSGSARRSARSA
jgi:GMP synthase (glutamine-hydrolysing)